MRKTRYEFHEFGCGHEPHSVLNGFENRPPILSSKNLTEEKQPKKKKTFDFQVNFSIQLDDDSSRNRDMNETLWVPVALPSTHKA